MSEKTSGNNPGKRYEAFGAYYFRVDLYKPGTNDVMGSYPFRSCSGLKSEAAVVELEEGGFNGTTRKLIGRTKFPNIVLKQGLCNPNSDLWKLRQSYMNGAEAKWLFTGGWVCKWEGPDLDASKNEVSIESIEIAHEGLMMLPGKEAK